jgi:hypothetical protein
LVIEGHQVMKSLTYFIASRYSFGDKNEAGANAAGFTLS